MSVVPASGARDAAAIRDAIASFLESAISPCILEPGDESIRLAPGNYELTLQNGRVLLHAWDERRTVCRRLDGVGVLRRGRLEFAVERFGGKRGKLWLVDEARPDTSDLARRSVRLSFQELFRQWLAQQFPEWRLRELTTEADLEHSLSPVYPRARLSRGSQAIAAIASPHGARAGDVLTFGLIWLDYLRRERQAGRTGPLVLFVPDGTQQCVCQRIHFLNPSQARFEVFAYTADGFRAVDLDDFGNLDTSLERVTAADADAEMAAAVEGLGGSWAPDGSIRLRVRGLEIARVQGGKAWFGLNGKSRLRTENLGELRQLAAEIARRRDPVNGDPRDPVFHRAPEAWLEDRVRAEVAAVDATLLRSPVYSQVPQWSGGERGILDLVAVDHTGRLAVIELKASEELHLPLQALDYWMRVKWHLDRGDFSSTGYFPGIAVRRSPPRLLLVSPALEFHPSSERILRFFDPSIDVERIGLAASWRRKIDVVFHLRGAERADGVFELKPNQSSEPR